MSEADDESEYPAELLALPERLRTQYSFIRILGTGKTGKVYQVRARATQHDYCLKTLSPEVTSDIDRQRVFDTLKKEVLILRALRHRCIPLVFENSFKPPLPYYVCTYHPGVTLSEFRKRNARLTLDEGIFVIGSLIDTLEYLHGKGRTHCDLHLENIMLSEKVFAEGLMVIDFGSGHRESDSSPETPDRGYPGGKSIDGLRRHQKPVARATGASDFRSNDLRGLGAILAHMEEALFFSATYEQLRSYREFCRQLKDGQWSKWKDVREHFSHVVDPMSFITGCDKHFVLRDGSRPAITLPASDPTPVGESVLKVINTKVFQRLRSIKQLSFCDWYYPGATHSRFEHSIGVFGVVRQALTLLSRDSNFRARYTQQNVTSAMLAGLIHDIGHYPFAHVIEHYVSARYSDDRALRKRIHHANYSSELIDTDRELRGAISKYWGEDMLPELQRVLEGKLGSICEILDGPIDCDKLDYLRRDAHHCGVPYGTGLDVKSVLAAYKCPEQGNHLLVDASRVPAVEGFMIVQDQMLSSVYWHETVRAVFAMFHRFLDGAIGRNPKTLGDLVDQLKKCNSEADAFREVFQPLLKSRGAAGKDMLGTADELLPLVRLHQVPSFEDIYRPIARYSRADTVDPKLSGAHSNVFDTIMSQPTTNASNVPISWNKVKRLRSCYAEAVGEKAGVVGRFDVLVDVPWGKASNRTLQVVEEDGATVRPITESAHLADSIFSDPTAFAAPIRVYVSPRLYSLVEDNLPSIQYSANEAYYGKGVYKDDFDEV